MSEDAKNRMNAQFVEEAVDALMWMHYDKSLGLRPGDRHHIEGVARLRAQRDALLAQLTKMRGIRPI